MEFKEKIKLLSDLQSAAEDENILKTLKDFSPSGEVIETIFTEAIEAKIKTLLGEMSNNEDVSQEIDSINGKLTEINLALETLGKSELMRVLYSINQKIGAATPAQQPSPPQQPTPAKAPSEPRPQTARNSGSTMGYL